MAIYGYARVSSTGQDLETQIADLRAAGAVHVYEEKMSGKSRDARQQLKLAIKRLGQGDVLLVTRLDRLARSSRDLLNIIGEISERRAEFRSLGDAWADTTTPHGKLMITVLGGLAEFERHLIQVRTERGIEKAKKDGVRFGRNPKLTAYQRKEILKRYDSDEPVRDIARSYGVHHSMICRIAADRENAVKNARRVAA